MKKQIFILFLGTQFVFGQVGVNTANPQAIFHVDGAKDNPDTGLPSANQQANDFYVTSSGQLGIGIMNPTQKTEINGNLQINNTSSAYGSFVRLQNSDGALMTLQATNSSSGYGKRGVIGTTSNDEMVFIQNSNSILAMNANTLYPISSNSTSLGRTGNIYANVYANNFITPSDFRFKKDIKNINYGIEDIMKIRPVSYYLKDQSDSHEYLGFIAQEIEKIVPEIVITEKNNEGYRGVDYIKLVPVLVKGMQEQQAKIEALTKNIEEMQSFIDKNKRL